MNLDLFAIRNIPGVGGTLKKCIRMIGPRPLKAVMDSD